MPTYDYKCKDCNHIWEEFHNFNQDIEICPSCSESSAEKQLGIGGGFIFRGAGFHATDYRKSDVPGSFRGDDDSCTRGH